MARPDAVKKPHVLVIPHFPQGHLIPVVSFSKQLARKGATITLVSFETEVSRLASDDPELANLDFRLVGMPKPNEAFPGSLKQVSDILEKCFKPFADKLIHDHHSGLAGPSCIVADSFILWTQDLASQLSIPYYMFVTSGALVSRLLQATEDLFIRGRFKPSADGSLEKFDGKISIPGIPTLQYHELVTPLLHSPCEYRERSRIVFKAAGLISNTFYELETSAVDTLRRPPETTIITTPKIYPTGPLFQISNLSNNSSIVQGLEDCREQCLHWLDSQQESSVLYICFGSLFGLNSVQIKELALGLETSNQSFLWVLPMRKVLSVNLLGTAPVYDSCTEVLPPGFEARVGERGCIVRGWAPQIQVLSHQSTGGFLTHCGWNSCLEAVSLGVPMLAWPICADQYMDCRYLVDELKVAIEIRRGLDNIPEQKEVERAVKLLLVEEEGKLMKRRVEELKVKAAAAVAEGGSSAQTIQEFMDDISNFET